MAKNLINKNIYKNGGTIIHEDGRTIKIKPQHAHILEAIDRNEDVDHLLDRHGYMALGGIVDDVKSNLTKKNILDAGQNVGAFGADNFLSIFGASNVANKYYTDSKVGQAGQDVSKITNPLYKTAGVLAANIVGGPIGGAALGQVQNTVGSIDQPSQEQIQNQNDWDKAGNYVGTAANIGSNFVKFGTGGSTNMSTINVEGDNRQEGPSVIMSKKGELMTKDGKILKNFVSRPPHPVMGIDPKGTTTEPTGMTIIPKNMTKEYLDRNIIDRKQMEISLMARQSLANKKMKKGGMIPMMASGGPFPNVWDMSSIDYINSSFNNALNVGNPYTGPNQINNSTNISPFNENYGGVNKAPVQSPLNPTTPNKAVSTNPSAGWGSPISPLPGSLAGPSNSTKAGGALSGISGHDANTALSLAAPTYNLLSGILEKPQQLNSGDYMNNAKVNWQDVGNEESQRAISDSYNLASNQMARSGRYKLSGQIALNTIRQKQMADARERVANFNSQGRFNAGQVNAGIEGQNKQMRYQVDDWNARSKASGKSQTGKGIEQFSQFGQQNLYNEEFWKYLKKTYPKAV